MVPTGVYNCCRMTIFTKLPTFCISATFSSSISFTYSEKCNSVLVFVMFLISEVYYLYYNFFCFKRIIYLLALTDLIFPLLKLIRKGKIDAALGKLGEWYPDIVQVNYLNFRAII